MRSPNPIGPVAAGCGAEALAPRLARRAWQKVRSPWPKFCSQGLKFSSPWPTKARNPWLQARCAALLAASALLLNGCAQWGPRPDAVPVARPAVPDALPLAASAPNVPNEAQPLPAWPQWLADPALERLVDLALANNRDLQVALLNTERAQAQWRAADAQRWPTLGVGTGVQRSPNSRGEQANVLSLGLQMPAWEIDAWGRLRELGDAARAQWLASDAGARSARVSVSAAVVQLAIALRADDRLLAIARRTLAGREETLRLVRLREAAGASSMLELQAQIGLAAAARATLAQLERQRAQDAHALALLIGQPLPAEWAGPPADPGLDARSQAPSGAGDLAHPDALARLGEVPVGLSSQVLLRRPDVQQAEQQLLAARANLAAARAALWPTIALTAQAGQVSPQLSGLFQGGNFAYTAAANLLLTVFDQGRREAGIAAADASQRIALAQYERAVQAAFRETADALVALDTWRRQQAALRDALAAARETARLTELKFSQGAASLLERLEAERSLFSAEQAVVQARLAELSAQVALYKALAP